MPRRRYRKNRRRHQRFEAPLAIEWARIDATTGRSGPVRHTSTFDISPGGLAFASGEPVPVGSSILVDLRVRQGRAHLPRARAAVAACMLTGSGQYRVGIRLLAPASDEEAQARDELLSYSTRTRSSVLDRLAAHLDGMERDRIHRAQRAIRRTSRRQRGSGPERVSRDPS